MVDYYDFLREQQSFLYLGETGGDYAATWPYGERDLPSYPDVPPRRKNLAKSNRILNTAVIAASRMMGSDPLPTWMDIDPMTHEFRQEAFQRRYREQEMQEDTLRGWWDGYNLGVGAVQTGFLDKDGGQVPGTAHINVTCLAWDPLCPSPVESDWIAATRFLPLEDAQAMYPSIGTQRTCQLITNQMGISMEVVRIVEYWHRGNVAFAPTYCVFAGQLDYGPVRHQSNPWGNMIPVALYVHLCPPGMQRPVGQVWLQMASQIQLHEIEADMHDKFINGKSIDLIDPSKMDKQDWKKVKKGEQRFIKLEPGTDGQVAFVRIPEQQIAAASLQLLQYMESRTQEESGMNDLERGAPLSGERSATEISVLDARSQMNQAYVARQTALYMTRFVTILSKAFKIGDTAPCLVEYDGQPYVINGMDDENLLELTMAAVFDQETMVRVDQDSLTTAQSLQRKRAKAADFMQVLQTPYAQGIPPEFALEVLMKNLGLDAEWAKLEGQLQQAQAMPMPGMDPSQVPGAPAMAPQTPF